MYGSDESRLNLPDYDPDSYPGSNAICGLTLFFVGQQITFTLFFLLFPVSKVNYSRESGEDVTSPKHGKVRYLLCKTRKTTRTRFSQY